MTTVQLGTQTALMAVSPPTEEEVETTVRAFVACSELVLPSRIDIKEFYLCLLLGAGEPFIRHICAQVDQ